MATNGHTNGHVNGDATDGSTKASYEELDSTKTGQKNFDTKEGKTAYGSSAVKRILEQEDFSQISDEHEHVLRTFRLLIADLCQQFGGGHPGGAIGMAAIGVALWRYVMKYSPNEPEWFDRDRFVLSNGHCCLWQYTFLHLCGFSNMTFDQLKSYHSDRRDMLCPGHPEKEHQGIELTTGPLGQGITNAVGLAIASKHLAAEFNKPDFPVVNNHIWCMVGDACLQEGVALEAISFAGHQRLNNLTVMYDNNQITCDGSVDMTNTENINAKMEACGWNVINVSNGNYDIEGIMHALEVAKRSEDKPTFINIPTIIGLGSAVAGKAVSHGAALGKDNVREMKKLWGFNPDEHFRVDESVREFFAPIKPRGDRNVKRWNEMVEKYSQAHPELAKTFKQRLSGDLPIGWEATIPTTENLPKDPTPTRQSNGHILQPLADTHPTFMVGTADLTPSVHMMSKKATAFQHPDLKTQVGINGNYNGRYLHYGIREHAMCAISNGLAAYHPGTIIPVTSSFFMFYLYAAPAVRMGSLQHLQVIHVATHDSIGTGEDGPTHQPLEVAALFRAMPNFWYFRPADGEEAAGAWICAIKQRTGSSMISTSRQKLKQFGHSGMTKRAEVAKGMYVVKEVENADMTVIGVGPEFEIMMGAVEKLEAAGKKVRVVSAPCTRLFDTQDRAYQRKVLGRGSNVPVVAVEAYTALGWERYANAAVCMSTKRFGQSLPGPDAYNYFGFTAEKVAKRLEEYLGKWKAGEFIPGEFEEITETPEHGSV